jgi:Rha family phage regulatory protein
MPTFTVSPSSVSALVTMDSHGKIFCTSRMIAEKFNKEHGHILRDIAKLAEDLSETEDPFFGQANFGLSSYKNAQNKDQPEYIITKDGFMLLVMGFTGKEAVQWKSKFIQAFNQMEQALLEQQKPRAIVNPALAALMEVVQHLDQVEQEQVRQKQQQEQQGKVLVQMQNDQGEQRLTSAQVAEIDTLLHQIYQENPADKKFGGIIKGEIKRAFLQMPISSKTYKDCAQKDFSRIIHLIHHMRKNRRHY